MSNRSIYVSTATGKETTKPNACDCTAQQAAPCRLDCLERPRFYAGQLLTDQDLSALAAWTSDKLRLARFVAGWGVVCGLQVEAVKDDKKPGWVTVKAGYARDCCGRDIVVCTDCAIDLSKICQQDKGTGCSNAAQVGQQANAQQGAGSAEETTLTLCGEQKSQDSIYTVDLHLSYQEKETRLQTPLIRNGCYEVQRCEPSRVCESHQITPTLVSSTGAAESPFDAWATQYSNWLTKVLNEVADKASKVQLCQVMQHYHKAPVQATCYGCPPEDRVPLARVWLEQVARADPSGKLARTCEVLAIDSYAPHRRELMVDLLPAPPRKVNLAHLLWQRYDDISSDAARKIHELGFHIADGLLERSADEALDLLRNNYAKDKIANELCLPHTAGPLKLKVVDLDDLGMRIVGFCLATIESDNGPEQQPGEQGRQAPTQTTPAQEEAGRAPEPPTPAGPAASIQTPPAETQAEGDVEIAPTAPAPASPQPRPPDDLQRIKGVGPKYAEILADAQYTTFADVANMSPEELRSILAERSESPITIPTERLQTIIASARAMVQGNG